MINRSACPTINLSRVGEECVCVCTCGERHAIGTGVGVIKPENGGPRRKVIPFGLNYHHCCSRNWKIR